MDKHKIYEELDNIWYHYKPHILAGIFIAAIVIYIIFSSVHNQKKETALQVILTGNQVSTEQKQNLQQAATKKVLGKTTSESIVRMDFWQVNGSMNGALQQKLVAMITTKDVDVVVMDKKTFLVFARQGNFLELDQIKQDLPEDVPFFTASVKGKDTRKKAYGIEISQNERLRKAGFNTKSKILGVVANSQHNKLDVQFIKWLVRS